ncbi:GNAT family N-acetyltransferase [Thalassospira sp. TSL5-1]|uniref:GNAT family N-acetyltransferase n=1 Tax=Thalassospira sp. TSL5-1 TaxID=1544451 RepID=UPI00093C65C6|nr:GNAT family N-acetyltransferase [Thalassospira sp. TSL5-1]OKH87105.1 GCN5 family acetyltransferase [Thalassospira sp. TSL5-1]
MLISGTGPQDYNELISLWERSVRATHAFLVEKDILRLRDVILDQYFDAVELFCARDENGVITGFIGIAKQRIEMLFVTPNMMGQGIGRALVADAITTHGITDVDVNEQNPDAVGFYQRMGFVVFGRSETDGEGNPFPILHMRLASASD